MASDIVQSLRPKIKDNIIKLVLAAGVKNDVKAYFEQIAKTAGLRLGGQIEIIYSQDKTNFFKKFNEYLRVTDILWTKPSELVFYAGLGIPIITAPAIGAHEFANQDWLIKTGAGLEALDPKTCGQWLFDWLDQGWLAEAALEGYLEIGHSGVKNILEIL